ncbi:MAG: hypothetical protein NVS1B6_02580 [Steroidobacteraceae bacterium]
MYYCLRIEATNEIRSFDGGDSPQCARLAASSANVKLIYATLLAAQMTGRPVTVAVIPGSNGCIIRYVTSP